MEFVAKFFDPVRAGGIFDETLKTTTFAQDGSAYVYQPDIILAVNVALATHRPLLVAGPPGAGKSTLARNVALVLRRQYYAKVITSRTQARDLEWQFDAIRRLSDAQVKGGLKPLAAYVQPEVLWWSFDPASARFRGSGAQVGVPDARDPGEGSPDTDAVVLLDEIDKAEPDVPNDLLTPLDVGTFDVEGDELFEVKRTRDVLVIVTTNGERELPPAFIRRCVTLTLPDPTRDWLVAIADQRFPGQDGDLHGAVAEIVMNLQEAAKQRSLRPPSTAEFLDALEACNELSIRVGSTAWERIRQTILWKHPNHPSPQ